MKEGGLMKKYTANVFVKDELKEITNQKIPKSVFYMDCEELEKQL